MKSFGNIFMSVSDCIHVLKLFFGITTDFLAVVSLTLIMKFWS